MSASEQKGAALVTALNFLTSNTDSYSHITSPDVEVSPTINVERSRPSATQRCKVRHSCECLCMHKLQQAEKAAVPCDTFLHWWLNVNLHLIPSNVFKKITTGYMTKTKHYCVDRRLPFTWLSCMIKITHNRQGFWVYHKTFSQDRSMRLTDTL